MFNSSTIDVSYLLKRRLNEKESSKQLQVKKEKKARIMFSNKIDVKIKLLRSTSKKPEKATDGSAAFDLFADVADKFVIGPRSTVLVPTGISIAIPQGYCGLILPRSGISLKSPLRISNSPGLIDSDYRGEIGIIVDNLGEGFANIENGMKLAQIMIIPHPEVRFQETDDLGETVRGKNGFGSTGTK